MTQHSPYDPYTIEEYADGKFYVVGPNIFDSPAGVFTSLYEAMDALTKHVKSKTRICSYRIDCTGTFHENIEPKR